jgi:ferritin-like metal-binding protein YciE
LAAPRLQNITRHTHFKGEIMSLKTLDDALLEELADLLSAETQLTEALPKMAQAATNPQLRAGFEEHLLQTQNQIERLNQAFKLLGQEPESKTCKAMKGLIAEGDELLKEDADPQVKDALLIAAAQKVEHYEIASYGTVCTWADLLGNNEVKELLGQTLNEEEQTDQKLTKLAESKVNTAAA